MDKTMELMELYQAEYTRQVVAEYGHNRFDDFSMEDKASISAIGLMIASIQRQLASKKGNKYGNNTKM